MQWEVDTGLCRHVWSMEGPVSLVAWNPFHGSVVAAACGNSVVFLNIGIGDKDSKELTEVFLDSASKGESESSPVDEGDSGGEVKHRRTSYGVDALEGGRVGAGLIKFSLV